MDIIKRIDHFTNEISELVDRAEAEKAMRHREAELAVFRKNGSMRHVDPDAFIHHEYKPVFNHEAEKQYLAAERRSMTAQEAAELRQAAHEAWQDSYCPQHREDLPCAQCEQELLDEKRQEGFLDRHESVQDANARILLNAWKIGEHLGPKRD